MFKVRKKSQPLLRAVGDLILSIVNLNCWRWPVYYNLFSGKKGRKSETWKCNNSAQSDDECTRCKHDHIFMKYLNFISSALISLHIYLVAVSFPIYTYHIVAVIYEYGIKIQFSRERAGQPANSESGNRGECVAIHRRAIIASRPLSWPDLLYLPLLKQ